MKDDRTDGRVVFLFDIIAAVVAIMLLIHNPNIQGTVINAVRIFMLLALIIMLVIEWEKGGVGNLRGATLLHSALMLHFSVHAIFHGANSEKMMMSLGVLAIMGAIISLIYTMLKKKPDAENNDKDKT